MLTLYYMVIVAAIIVMLAGFYMVTRLKQTAPGGSIGRVVNILIFLIAIFTSGYLLALYMPKLPVETSLIFVALIYLFGSVFVVLVLWLINNLVRQVMSELKL